MKVRLIFSSSQVVLRRYQRTSKALILHHRDLSSAPGSRKLLRQYLCYKTFMVKGCSRTSCLGVGVKNQRKSLICGRRLPLSSKLAAWVNGRANFFFFVVYWVCWKHFTSIGVFLKKSVGLKWYSYDTNSGCKAPVW